MATQDAKLNRPPAVIRLLFPSIHDLIFVAFVFALGFGAAGSGMLADTSVGWHIVTGDIIRVTGTVPTSDTFSFSKPGHPWFAWEWLWDVLASWINSRIGLNGIVVATALMIAGVFTAAYRTSLKQGALPTVAALFTLMAVATSAIHFLTRPHVVSWLFVLLWAGVLRRFYLGERSRLWLLPATMLLWVNLHGGFILGPILLVITGAALVWDLIRTRDTETRRRLLRSVRILVFVSVIVAATTLATPYGYHLHAHIADYLRSSQIHHIEEFLTPNFHEPQPRIFAALAFLAVVGLAAGSTVTTLDVLLVLFATYTGLYSQRSIPISALLLVPIASRLLSEAVQRAAGRSATALDRVAARFLAFSQRIAKMEAGLNLHGWAITATLAAVLVALNGGRVNGATIMSHDFEAERVPARAASYLIDTLGVREGFFNFDYWGGYLIYTHRAKGIRVGADDRSDYYGDEFVLTYIDLVTARSNWQQVLDDWKLDYALVTPDSVLATLLRASPRWELEFEDKYGVVFARKNGARQ